MLVKVFTVWLMASNITVLSPMNEGCRIYFNNKDHAVIREKTCDEVAIKINKELRDVK